MVTQAIKDFLAFREETGVSRDKAIEIYGFFKLNPDCPQYVCNIGVDTLTVLNEPFWKGVNTSIIRRIYSKNYDLELDLKNEEVANNAESDDFTKTEYSKIRKENVLYKAKLDFEKKAFNKKLKDISSIEELNKELIENLKKLKPTSVRYSHKEKVTSNDGVGVIVLSDTHFNELIDTPSNKYDFDIASKRLYKLSDTAIKHFKSNKIDKVVILGLGDFLNSDRRQSEYMNMATNRAKAVVLSYHLLKQFISDISDNFETIVSFQSGNESRVVGEEFDTSEEIATYNYDFTLFNMLKISFEKTPVTFLDGSFGEKVVNINGSNVLLTHGINIKSDIEKSVAQTFGRFANIGVTLDYMFMGHYHSSRVGDTYARCGSLCGGNSYSEGTLNLTSKASQLIGIFYSDKSNNIMKVDLQNVDDQEGYNIVEELEAYNTKSAKKKSKYLVHYV